MQRVPPRAVDKVRARRAQSHSRKRPWPTTAQPRALHYGVSSTIARDMAENRRKLTKESKKKIKAYEEGPERTRESYDRLVRELNAVRTDTQGGRRRRRRWPGPGPLSRDRPVGVRNRIKR